MLKKYIGTVSLALAVVLVISIFYVNGANANKFLPQYEIHQTSGDPNIQLEAVGNLQIGVGHTFGERNVTIDNEGSAYSQKGLFSTNYYEEDMDELRKEYPGFLRRKYQNGPYCYYEDKERIGYASDSSDGHLALDIAVYDKKTEKADEFELGLPKIVEEADNLSVYRVVLSGNEMKVIAGADYIKNDKHYEELYMFVIDLPNKKLERKKKLYVSEGDSNLESTYLSYPSLIKSGKKDNNFIFMTIKEIFKNEEEEPIEKGREYYNVNLKKEKVEKMDSKAAEEAMEPITVRGDVLYSLKLKKQQLLVQLHNMKNKKDLKTFTFNFDEKLSSETSVQLKVENGKLFIYTNEYTDYYSGMPVAQGKWPHIIIADGEDGKVEFAGRIVPKPDRQVELAGYELQIMDINLK